MSKIVMTILLSIFAIGCAKDNRSAYVAKTAVSASSSSGVDSLTFLGCSSDVSASAGRLIYSDYNNSNEIQLFTQQVKDFASSFISPSKLGNISGDPTASTGIEVSGKLLFDKTGSLDKSNSQFKLEIYDDKVGTVGTGGVTIQSIPVSLSAATSGKWDRSTGKFEVVFSDQYGEVTLRGVIQSGYTTADVTYVNKTHVDGLTPKSGSLGTFYIYSCGFIY